MLQLGLFSTYWRVMMFEQLINHILEDKGFKLFLCTLLISVLVVIIINHKIKDNFKRTLFNSIVVTITIICVLIYMKNATNWEIFKIFTEPEIMASMMIAIPTLSTWIRDSEIKKEFERIENLKSAQEIRENLIKEKEILEQEVAELAMKIDIKTFELLLILNKLEDFLLKAEEVADIYQRLNTITFKLDLDYLFSETYHLFEMLIKIKILSIKSANSKRFGQIFTRIIKNKLLYGISVKTKSDINRDLTFLMLPGEFKKVYYIDFCEALDGVLPHNVFIDGDLNDKVAFEKKEFVECTLSDLFITILGPDNRFENCDVSKLSSENLVKYREYSREDKEEYIDDDEL